MLDKFGHQICVLVTTIIQNAQSVYVSKDMALYSCILVFHIGMQKLNFRNDIDEQESNCVMIIFL